MITAKQARAQSNKVGRAQSKVLAIAKRELARRAKAEEPKIVQALIDLAIAQIKNAATDGNYTTTVEVPRKSVGERVIHALTKQGFTASVHCDPVFVGVDEWEDRWTVIISWVRP